MWQIDAELRTAAVVEKTLVHAARVLLLVLGPGTVHDLVAHLLHGNAHAAGLIAAAVKLRQGIASVHRFFCEHQTSDDRRFVLFYRQKQKPCT